jgi:hypothetical protein
MRELILRPGESLSLPDGTVVRAAELDVAELVAQLREVGLAPSDFLPAPAEKPQSVVHGIVGKMAIGAFLNEARR